MARRSATVLALAGVALMIPVTDASAINQGTKSGVFTQGCLVDWRAKSVMDIDLTDDEEGGGLMSTPDGTPITAYANGGYIMEVRPELSPGSGILEVNHFYAGNSAVWRIPLSTDKGITGGKVIVTLPEAGAAATFDSASTSDRMHLWGDPYSDYTWAAGKTTAVPLGEGKFEVTLQDLQPGQGTVFQFSYPLPPGTDRTVPVYASAEMTGTYTSCTGSLDGTVYNDLNADSTRDAGEDGVGSYEIEIFKGDTTDADAKVRTVTTTAEGAYGVDDLAPGTYTLVYSVNGTTHTRVVQVIGFATTTHDVAVPPTGTIKGNVFKDGNQDAQRDASEAGVAQFTVTLKNSSGDVFATTTTNEDGSYAFDNVPLGEYTVTITATDEYGRATTPTELQVALTPTSLTREVDFGVLATTNTPTDSPTVPSGNAGTTTPGGDTPASSGTPTSSGAQNTAASTTGTPRTATRDAARAAQPGTLARTGADMATAAGVALTALLSGAAMKLRSRRRRFT